MLAQPRGTPKCCGRNSYCASTTTGLGWRSLRRRGRWRRFEVGAEFRFMCGLDRHFDLLSHQAVRRDGNFVRACRQVFQVELTVPVGRYAGGEAGLDVGHADTRACQRACMLLGNSANDRTARCLSQGERRESAHKTKKEPKPGKSRRSAPQTSREQK